MSLIQAPPQVPPQPIAPREGVGSPLELDALFEEAHERKRARRGRALLVTAAALTIGLVAYAVHGTGASSATANGAPRSGLVVPAVPAQSVVILLDVSGSMAANDLRPSRLAATTAGIRSFLKTISPRVRVGLVTFSVTPSVLVPPTLNRTAVTAALTDLSTGSGTALGSAVDAASHLVVASLSANGITKKLHGRLPGAVILVTDGAQNRGTVTPLAAALHARSSGIAVDAIAVGTATGSVAFGYGQAVSKIPVPLDPEDVKRIAGHAGGTAYVATDRESLDAAFETLAKRLNG